MSYIPYNWKNGDTITAEKLNRMEEGIANALTEIPDNGNSAGGGDVYSTEETKIGTWIDYEPIYRRVFKTKTPAEGGNAIVVPNSSYENLGIGQVIACKGIVKVNENTITSSGFIVLPYVLNSLLSNSITTTGFCAVAALSNGLYCRVGFLATGNQSAFYDADLWIILEYTKSAPI